jgi:hypothetical protein
MRFTAGAGEDRSCGERREPGIGPILLLQGKAASRRPSAQAGKLQRFRLSPDDPGFRGIAAIRLRKSVSYVSFGVGKPWLF